MATRHYPPGKVTTQQQNVTVSDITKEGFNRVWKMCNLKPYVFKKDMPEFQYNP